MKTHNISFCLLIFAIFSTEDVAGRRRVSQANRAFEQESDQQKLNDFISAPGIDREDDGGEEKATVSSKSSVTKRTVESTTVTTTTTTASQEPQKSDEDLIERLLDGIFNLENLTKSVEEENAEALNEATNRTILWIDTSYKALDFNLTVDEIEECAQWQKFWNMTAEAQKINETNINETEVSDDTLLSDLMADLKETELVKSKSRLKIIGLNPELLEAYKAVGLVYREICGNHGRTLWYRSRDDANRIGVDSFSPICEPFKEELNPDAKTLSKLALKLNYLIQNVTDGLQPALRRGGNLTDDEEFINVSTIENTSTTKAPTTSKFTPTSAHTRQSQATAFSVPKNSEVQDHDRSVQLDQVASDINEVGETPTTTEFSSNIEVYDDDVWDYRDMEQRFKVRHQVVFDETEQKIDSIGVFSTKKHKRSVILKTKVRRKRSTDSESEETEKKEESDVGEDESEDDWLNVRQIIKTEDGETTVAIVEEHGHLLDGNMSDIRAWIEIDASDAINPTLLLASPEAVSALGLDVEPTAFQRFENVGLYLPGICSEYVPRAIDEFNSSSFEGVEIEGPIGVNITALELAGVNLTALAEKLRNDTEVDEILSRTNGSTKNLGGSFILPVLNKNQYDPFSAPIVFQGSAVVVRFGIYIESMSNFQTSTMDYDMDIYLMMSWRDARLVNPYDKPILVKEEDILEKIWRPDPFFANAKEAEFHEVTFLNFLMRIFPDGLVLYETRVKIKPSCNLILCKYPHDKQTCDLLIKSFVYPIETVRFEWFTRRKDAIDKNPDVKLPELYIDRYETTTCPSARKSGDFSCLRAVFRLKRDVGFHIAQTYIPTSLALMFSWVGVWLPEEFMEGRIGVAITVLLTLSTESAGAREHLPSVSYLKAIDLWFGFITGFVFFTLLQTLFVIGFDKRANQLRKWAARKTADITEEIHEALLQKATRYHKTGRYLDNFCRVFYPLSFLLFLFMYYFVFTEGRQDDCMNRR